MNLISIDNTNLDVLFEFIEIMGSSKKNFRYFDKRKPEDAIKNHIVTLILTDKNHKKNSSPLAYGHLDFDSEKVWLGICVIEDFLGKGYADFLMKKLLNSYEGKIFLSVDKENTRAIGFYERHLFKNILLDDIKPKKGLLFMVYKK